MFGLDRREAGAECIGRSVEQLEIRAVGLPRIDRDMDGIVATGDDDNLLVVICRHLVLA